MKNSVEDLALVQNQFHETHSKKIFKIQVLDVL